MSVQQQPIIGQPLFIPEISDVTDDMPFRRGMWCKVIILALRDAASNTIGCVDAICTRAMARLWFFAAAYQDDFNQVCEYAGRCPQQVRRDAERVLSAGLRFGNSGHGASFHFAGRAVHAVQGGA